jgi:hypothetical protein
MFIVVYNKYNIDHLLAQDQTGDYEPVGAQALAFRHWH